MQGIGAGSILRRKENGKYDCMTDEVAIEEPLEIRIAGSAIATTMRPPGHDEGLTACFLWSEAIVHRAAADFARSGVIHAAPIFDLSGDPRVVLEDMGRHKPVDKVLGLACRDRLLPLNQHVVLVRGRSSLEIVQKALAAGIPIVAAVSAPSSLAVNFTRECGQTLIGFLRPPTFNVYSHIERIEFDR